MRLLTSILVFMLACHRAADLTPSAARTVEPKSLNHPAVAAPQITITTPNEYSEYYPLNTPIAIVARINPAVAVKKVTFYSDNVVIPSTTADPLRTFYQPPAGGQHSLRVRAELASGRNIESAPVKVVVEEIRDNSLDQTDESLSFNLKRGVSAVVTQPHSEAAFKANDRVVIAAEISSTEGTIQQVAFLVDGNVIDSKTGAPYQTTWIAGAAGRHLLTVRARDSRGFEGTSREVPVEVRP